MVYFPSHFEYKLFILRYNDSKTNTSSFLLVSNEERPQINSFRHSVENNNHSVLTWKD